MPDDVQSSRAELRVGARCEGAEAIVAVEGDLDHSTAERFLACILEALDTKPRSVTVDAHAVTFTDSSGLSALLRARGLAFVDQVVFRISDPSPRLRGSLSRLGSRTCCCPTSDPRGAGDARRSPARPYPGSSGRLSGGPSHTHRDRADPGVRYQSMQWPAR
jgi:anti-anti-sigma factor